VRTRLIPEAGRAPEYDWAFDIFATAGMRHAARTIGPNRGADLLLVVKHDWHDPDKARCSVEDQTIGPR
jgi:hypothetical protein